MDGRRVLRATPRRVRCTAPRCTEHAGHSQHHTAHHDDDAGRAEDARGVTEHVELHRDGSVRARGPMVDGAPEGHWEWFRLDGSRMRSGWFEHGEQVGEWTTYDRAGIAYTTTVMKRPAQG